MTFRCNLCGRSNRVPAARIGREIPSCGHCGSTVRFRAIAHLLVRELLGREAALVDVAPRRDIRGIGLSDAPAYADPLARVFDYTNTFFHAAPRLDITDVPERLAGRHRFVVSSDVFEHVVPPVERAFAGARRLLDDEGLLMLTVPFSLDASTVEHFPDLHDWRIEGSGDGAVLHNVAVDGRVQRYHHLVFHGGDGATLEMRLFSRDALERALRGAGFSRIAYCDERCAPFGIAWPQPWSIPIIARP